MPAEPTQSPAQVASVPQEVTGQPRRVVVGGVTWRDTFAALKHRNFRLFFVGQLVSLTGSWMQNTAQGWLVYQLTGSKVLLGTVAAVGSLPMLLLSVWGGSVADRHSKRTVVFFTQTGMMLLAFVFAALVGSGRIQPWHILVLAALGGVAMAFDMPARQAFMVEMTSREDLMNAVSLNSSIVNGARVVGPAVAGFLMAQVGMTMVLSPERPELHRGHRRIADDASAQVCPPGGTGLDGAARAGRLRLRGGTSAVRILLLLFGVVGIFGWSYSVLLPAYATDILHVGERGYGALLSANGLGALLGALTVATYGNRVAATADDSGRAVGVLGHAAAAGRRALVSAGAGVHGGGRLGDAALLLDDQHAHPDQRVGCDARAGDGHLGAGVRRHDAHGRNRIGLAVAGRGCAVDGRGGRTGVRGGRSGDVAGGAA